MLVTVGAVAIGAALAACDTPLDLTPEIQERLDAECFDRGGGVRRAALGDDGIVRATCNDGYQIYIAE